MLNGLVVTFCRFLNRVSLSKDKVPALNHYFIYYTCEVRVRNMRSAFGRIYPHPVADAPFPPIWESGQARVPDWSRRLGSSPLSNFAAQGTFALTATRQRDCGRRSRPQTRSTSHAIDPPAAQIAMFPAMVNPVLNGEDSPRPENSIQPFIDQWAAVPGVLAWKMPGAGGGGYLALVVTDSASFAAEHPEAIELHIRRK